MEFQETCFRSIAVRNQTLEKAWMLMEIKLLLALFYYMGMLSGEGDGYRHHQIPALDGAWRPNYERSCSLL